MANVAGVAQLMETVVPATNSSVPTASSNSTSEHSFANVMQQANTAAGVPAVPVEQKTSAAQNDAGQPAGKTEDQKTAQATAQETESSMPSGKPAAAVAVQTSLRYTPANMLSAMLNRVGIAPATNTATAATQTIAPTAVPLSETSATLAAASAATKLAAAPNATASLTPAPATPSEATALDDKPIDLAVPAFAPAVVPAKPLVKPEISSAQAAGRSATKQEASLKVVEQAAAPAPAPVVPSVIAAPAPMSNALAVGASDQETSASSAMSNLPLEVSNVNGSTAPANSVGKVSSTAKPEAVIGAPSSALQTQPTPPSTIPLSSVAKNTRITSTTEQPNAATFKQSLASQSTVSVATSPVPVAASPTPFTTVANYQPSASATQQTTWQTIPPTIQPATAPTLPLATSIPAAASQPSQVTVSQVAAVSTAKVQTPLLQAQPPVQLQAQPQTATVSRTAKSIATGDALQSPAPASQTAVQPAASAPSTDGKAAPHTTVSAIPIPIPIPTPAPVSVLDGSAATLPITLAGAHTPVAITALSNATGPVLTTIAAPTSSSAANAADSLPHTTLASTPTTLEVGVSSGTHGWLKIRAELNASGTVDASLTGANDAATGRLHNDLPALSSFLQDERVAVGSLNVSAPGAATSALHATAAATLEPTSSFTRSAAEGVGATGTAVASDAGAAGGRAPQQQAPQSSPQVVIAREDDGVSRTIAASVPALYAEATELGGSGVLSEGNYGGGGSWLNVRV